MKYLRVLENETAHEAFKNGSEYVEPHICYLKNSGGIRLKAYTPPVLVGDVAYWNGSSVKTTPLSKWSTSLGAPVGVVVIPEGFAPDGRPRIVSLKPVDTSGNASSSHSTMVWGPTGTDTVLTNFNRYPITDNAGSTSTGSNSYGYLPSDKFTVTQSFVDAQAKYSQYSNLVPSPYLNDTTMNSAYSEAISGYNNALSDFNGLSNTQTLVGLGNDYWPANAAWNYSDGVSSIQWYLPAMGELGFLMPRFNAINAAIIAMGGIAVIDDEGFWSSSEYDSDNACALHPMQGGVTKYHKRYSSNCVRPFAIL